MLHQTGHGLEVSGAHLAGVGPLGVVLLTPAVVHASEDLADALVLGDEVNHCRYPGPSLHVLHRVDGAANPLLATQGTGNVSRLVNLLKLCREII